MDRQALDTAVESYGAAHKAWVQASIKVNRAWGHKEIAAAVARANTARRTFDAACLRLEGHYILVGAVIGPTGRWPGA